MHRVAIAALRAARRKPRRYPVLAGAPSRGAQPGASRGAPTPAGRGAPLASPPALASETELELRAAWGDR